MNNLKGKQKNMSNPTKILFVVMFILCLFGLLKVYEIMTPKGEEEYKCGSQSNDLGSALLKIEGIEKCPMSTQELPCESTFLASLYTLGEQNPQYQKIIDSMNFEDPKVIRVDFAIEGTNQHMEFFQPVPGSQYVRVPVGMCQVSYVENHILMSE